MGFVIKEYIGEGMVVIKEYIGEGNGCQKGIYRRGEWLS
jgi:hypothetical protein